MGAGLVLDGILDELESWDADGVERKVIGASGVAHAKRVHAEIFEGLHPGFKDRRYGFVFLQVYATDFSGAVVYVEIGGDFCLLGLTCASSASPPNSRC